MFNPSNRRGFLIDSDPLPGRQLDWAIGFAIVLFVVGIVGLIMKSL